MYKRDQIKSEYETWRGVTPDGVSKDATRTPDNRCIK